MGRGMIGRIIIVGLVILAGVPSAAIAGKWSDYVTVSTEGNVVVSYWQRLQKDGWLVEWRAENTSPEWVEPFAKTRPYLCADGSQKTQKDQTLGPYPPGDTRKGGIRDRGMCPGSEIQSVEVEIELRPVSEVMRRMWK